MLWWIDIKYACFGIVSKDHVVVQTAPIARWMIGKRIDEVLFWVKKKAGIAIEVDGLSTSSDGIRQDQFI